MFIKTEASIPPKKFKICQLYSFLSAMSLLHQQSQNKKGCFFFCLSMYFLLQSSVM